MVAPHKPLQGPVPHATERQCQEPRLSVSTATLSRTGMESGIERRGKNVKDPFKYVWNSKAED